MKTMKRLVLCLMCISVLLSLFGCGKKDRFILDGPGMVNVAAWKKLELSRSDSYAQFNFNFTLEQTDFSYTVSGECRDEDGTVYELESGICELSHTDYTYFKDMKLDSLENFKSYSSDLEAEVLDASDYSLILTYSDGESYKKSMDINITLDFYNRLLPYFIKNGTAIN